MKPSQPRYASPDYVLVTGFSQLPKGTPLSENQKVFACTLVLRRETGEIVDASFTFLMDLTEEFLKGLVIGRTLPDDWNDLQQAVKERFLVPTQGAILQALRSTMDRFLESTQPNKTAQELTD
jgi:hypothetical protein